MVKKAALNTDAINALDNAPKHLPESETSLAGHVLRTLKQGDSFLVTDQYGNIGNRQQVPEGLFYRDTRHLSTFELLIDERQPLLLSSVILDDNLSLSIDMTNPDLSTNGKLTLPRDLIGIERTKLIWDGTCFERVGFRNYDSLPRRFQISVRFASDFHDLFEVRGERRKARGKGTARIVDTSSVELRYLGLDQIHRLSNIAFKPAPTQLGTNEAIFDITLKPYEKTSFVTTVTCSEEKAATSVSFAKAYLSARRASRDLVSHIATVDSTNTLFKEITDRSSADIYMLVTQTESGALYPYAGIPWFSTVFGRDGIITAMMLLWSDPSIAHGVLHYLAETQAKEINPAADAQPGKILHERRFGEMSNLAEVPFARYYGTVDATPLFVMLAGQYFKRTGDLDTIKAIWPNIIAALNWCDTYGDRDCDGFVEYYRETDSGLANQGWKDSQDSVFHADGVLALGPIALCEVQGYVYAAKRAASDLAGLLGDAALGQMLFEQAEQLRTQFNESFWCEDLGSYALALDGDKQPCRVRSSNAGHALFTGIADPEKARRVAGTLMHPDSFSGWGIRTIAQSEARYNPMSYHNGSIWPHDNALIAMGFGAYGLKQEAAKVFSGMFHAATYQDIRRLPELFCGFLRRPKRGPTSYPVACSPQAWAAASPFAFISACVGLELKYESNEVHINDPHLPDFLEDFTLRGLRLGSSRLDLHMQRRGDEIFINSSSHEGNARFIYHK